MDPYKKLQVSLNSDGSLTRHADIPVAPPTGDTTSAAVLSKDVPLNETHNTWIRIFLPKNPSSKKLPIILYFHGGGFVLYSAASIFFHNSCVQISDQLPAIILSVEHRLAPEHRLPAAYSDAEDALLWLCNQARSPTDPWMKSCADFGRCFLMGSSSGGNIVYHLGLRARDLLLDLKPLNVLGIIMNQPFFGGKERTESEVRMEADKVVPLAVADLLWELALPKGANRDHEFCDPTAGIKRGVVKGMAKCLVRGYVGDPLIDRQRAVAKMMEEEGVRVVARLEEEGFHAIELFDSRKAEMLVLDIKSFIYDQDDDDKARGGAGGGGAGGGGGAAAGGLNRL